MIPSVHIIEAAKLIARLDPHLATAFVEQPFNRHAMVSAFHESLNRGESFRHLADEIAVALRGAIDADVGQKVTRAARPDFKAMTIGERVELILLRRESSEFGLYLGSSDWSYGAAQVEGMIFKVGDMSDIEGFEVRHIQSGLTERAESPLDLCCTVDRLAERVRLDAGSSNHPCVI